MRLQHTIKRQFSLNSNWFHSSQIPLLVFILLLLFSPLFEPSALLSDVLICFSPKLLTLSTFSTHSSPSCYSLIPYWHGNNRIDLSISLQVSATSKNINVLLIFQQSERNYRLEPSQSGWRLVSVNTVALTGTSDSFTKSSRWQMTWIYIRVLLLLNQSRRMILTETSWYHMELKNI